MAKFNKGAFSMVELVVVVTVLSILWFISFISFQWYAVSARDSLRNSDISSISTSLELFMVRTWYLPDPTSWENITYSWWKIWSQWTVWESMIFHIDKLTKIPKDPLTWYEYTYSRLNTKKEYELWSIIEKTPEYSFAPRTYALEQTKAYALVKWNYNWMIAKVSTWSLTYILSVPTVINSDMDITDITDIINNKKLAFNWYSNLPNSYKWSIFEMNWWFEYLWNKLVVFSWSLDDLIADEGLALSLIKNLQDNYKNTIITNESYIKWVVNIDIDLLNPSDESKELSKHFVENILWLKVGF